MTDSSVSPGALAGYRLVRKLAVGSRADVYLGVGRAGSVALKVFAATTPRESIGAELEALGRIDSPHLVRLLDVSSSSGELPTLVLERATQGSVAALLTERETLECGEAVTLLAPIATLIAELHDVGVAHGKIGPASVHLGSNGEPVLLGLGHCGLFSAGGSMAAIDQEPAAAADRDAIAAMALGILANVRSAGADAGIRDLLHWMESVPRAYEFPGELAERLFRCSEPLPIAIVGERKPAAEVPARLVNAAPADSQPASTPLLLPARPGWMHALFESPALLESPADFVKKRVLTLVRAVRPRFWVVAAAVAVALMVAIALIPSAGAPQAVGTMPSVPLPLHTRSESMPSPSATPLPDDPLLASKSLLAGRATCVRDLSILCLDNVDEASSAAFATDAALIQRVQEGGEIQKSGPAQGTQLALVERLGDTALVSLGAVVGAVVGAEGGAATGAESGAESTAPKGNSASILVIRTKAGWRIRDYLTGAQATASP